jgi:hypothetical protein
LNSGRTDLTVVSHVSFLSSTSKPSVAAVNALVNEHPEVLEPQIPFGYAARSPPFPIFCLSASLAVTRSSISL